MQLASLGLCECLQALVAQPAVKVGTGDYFNARRDLKEPGERGIDFEHPGDGVAADSQLIGHCLTAHVLIDGALSHRTRH